MAGRTVRQALIDEIHYPLKAGFVDNQLLKRDLRPEDEITAERLRSKGFIGAKADCLFSLIEAPNVSEAGLSVSLGDRNAILKKVNSLYISIGEEEKSIDVPTVTFGCPWRK